MHKISSYIFTFISNFKKEEILNLDKNVGIILRNYENKFDKNKILEIKQFCKAHKRKLFLSNNLNLAINLNLDGIYIPSFNKNLIFNREKMKKKFLILGSAHNLFEVKMKEKQNVDLIFLSPLFKTKDYSKGLGVIKFNLLSNQTKKKVIALGGISKKNINKINITRACGFSGISYFKSK
tara:strand:+ start:354 stop:893 length:540 start_codon:yes stop_codon:yes gene_type:complete